MFDPTFYASVLPDLVLEKCQREPGKVPVVEFRLADGTTIDVCHVQTLADKWITAVYFRDEETCDDMDTAFLPYELVVRVNVSLHHPETRRIGFAVADTTRTHSSASRPTD